MVTTATLRLQVMVAAADELYVGCESGELICGDFFMKRKLQPAAATKPLPGARSITALLLQPAAHGQGHYAVLGSMPCGVALFSTFAQQVVGVVTA
jgi:hypothetical protein